ncbi:unnamed protein product [Eruca vesicaria subsp. sativa]|uniref:Plant thionin family protein n=1 Tax=Eruca vesicaria subsp. sativa TaxID=29727 RepID=A0ABC8K0A4_ERUVS|nr:unnamed protein product [Eruca vesicaria subsp. sativa]
MEKKCMSMFFVMMVMTLAMMPLTAVGEPYAACVNRCESSCQIFFREVEKCIHDCIGIKCHKSHVPPRMADTGVFQEIHT